MYFSLAPLYTHRSHNLSRLILRARVCLDAKKRWEKKVWGKKTHTGLRRAVAFRFPGRNQSPLNRGVAEIRAPPRVVASIPPRLAPQSMPCPASCFFDCLFFVLQLIFSPLSLSPAGWRQNSVSLVAKPRLDPIKEKLLLRLHASLQRECQACSPPRCGCEAKLSRSSAYCIGYGGNERYKSSK